MQITGIVVLFGLSIIPFEVFPEKSVWSIPVTQTDEHMIAVPASGGLSTHSSGGITYHGSVTKTGSKYLRWIMLECLHVHIRNDKNSNVTQFYHRISKKKGNSKAAVAAASKLLKVVYWVMKENRTYHNNKSK